MGLGGGVTAIVIVVSAVVVVSLDGAVDDEVPTGSTGNNGLEVTVMAFVRIGVVVRGPVGGVGVGT